MTRVFYLVVLLTSLVIPARDAGAATWEKLYELPAREQWIISVWLAKDGSWRASAPHLILTGTAQGVRATETDGDDVLGFGEDASGAIVAVGTHQSIWEEDTRGFRKVHGGKSGRRMDRAARWDALNEVGYFDPQHPERIFAYASGSFSLWRDSAGAWQVTQNGPAVQRWLEGPVHQPPKGCHRAGWRWLDRADGFLECQEGHSYLYKNAVVTRSLGPMPRACRRGMGSLVRIQSDLFTVCGDPERVWQLQLETSHWVALSDITGVGELRAGNGCLLAATRRAVYRWCEKK
jgi:hypothetical protein